MTIKSDKNGSVALRRELLQMRLELNRQKIRHEALVLVEPVQKIRNYQKRFTQGAHPLLLVGGVTLASFFITSKRNSAGGLLSIARIASSLVPLFIKATKESSNVAADNDNLKTPTDF